MTSPSDTTEPADDAAPALDAPGDTDAPGSTGDPGATGETGEPDPHRPPADTAALVAATALPLVGVALALAGGTWLTVAIIMLTPLVLIAYGLGLWVFARVLRRASLLRRVYDGVPRRYRIYAWLWATSFLAAGGSPLLAGLDGPWQPQVAGVVGAAVLVGVFTALVWNTYVADMNADPAED